MIRAAAATAILCAAASGQSSFEAATIKLAAPGARGVRASIAGGGLIYSNTTLLNVLVRAFGLKFRGQVRGPSWVFTERYDITAKVPENTSWQQIPGMLQALLIERFKLTLHHETRDLPMYSLVVGKSPPKLKGAAEAEAIKNYWGLAHGHRTAKDMSMTALADFLTLMLDAPVLDRTGLAGYYDFPLEMSLEETGGATATQGDGRPTALSIFTIVQEFGLKLEPGKAPFDVVVIDQGEKVPIDN